MAHLPLLALLLIFALLPPSAAKYMSGSISLDSDNTEKFLTKFSFAADNQGRFQGTFNGHGERFEKSGPRHKLELGLFSDEAFLKYQLALKSGSLCSERMAFATSRSFLGARAPMGAEFAIDENIKPQASSHFYYFILADCSLEFYPSHPPTLDYTFHLTNADSELPADETGMLRINVLSAVGLLGALAFAATGMGAQFKRFGQVHLSSFAISLALALQFLACFFEFVHLSKYKSDGLGYRWRHGRLPLDFLSDTCQNLSEALAVVVVVSVGCGWTLIDGTFRELKTVARAAGGVFAFQFLVELLSRRYEEDFSSFHDHDHFPGYLLMLLRVVCCGLTVAGTRRALKRNQGDSRTTKFLTTFTIAASVWLLTFPFTVVFIAPMFSHYQRHCVVECSAIMLQSVALVGLLSIFLGVGEPGRAFLKASTIKDMGDLDKGHGEGGLGLGASPGGGGGKGILSQVKKIRKKVAVD
jgi:hypothetical protein